MRVPRLVKSVDAVTHADIVLTAIYQVSLV